MPARILVVDDYQLARRTIRTLLEWHRFNVCGEAQDGQEAIDKVIELKPDVVLLDVNMPGMNGIQLHRHLMASQCEVPVIFITAHGSEQGVRSQALQNGAVDYLIKPLSEDTVLNAVHKAFSANRNTQG